MFKTAGFTLIELLVVVLIIGILSAVALPQYQKAVDKARATEALTGLKSLADASNVYYLANGNYTGLTLDTLDVQMPAEGKDFTFSSAIYAPNHMDFFALDKRNRYKLTSVHKNGARLRVYCMSEAHKEICYSLGAASCQSNGECILP